MKRKFFAVISVLMFLLVSKTAFSTEANNVLRMALLPIPDVLPVYAALEKGYFEQEGVVVEALPVGSAVERDQLMQAGRVDGMINEISGAASFNRDKEQVRIVAVARTPVGECPLFRILAAPGSGIKNIEQLAGVPVAISKNTVIEYISTRMLENAGITGEQVVYKSVPVLPERLQLLLSGQIKAATLPDPLGSAAIKNGAVEVVNDLEIRDMSASVITFSRKSLELKEEAVKGFIRAWNKAAADINNNPSAYRALMLKKIRVPGNIRDSFLPPPLPLNQLPTRKQWDDVMDWMVGKGLLKSPLSFESTVTAEFLSAQ